MSKSVPFAILAAASLLSGTAAFAATAPATQAHTAAHTTVQKKTTTTTGPAVAAKTATTTRTTTKRAVARQGNGRLVTAKTSTGKTVTYDCGKAGNATKAACKK